jgi:hypothetical protein
MFKRTNGVAFMQFKGDSILIGEGAGWARKKNWHLVFWQQINVPK